MSCHSMILLETRASESGDLVIHSLQIDIHRIQKSMIDRTNLTARLTTKFYTQQIYTAPKNVPHHSLVLIQLGVVTVVTPPMRTRSVTKGVICWIKWS